MSSFKFTPITADQLLSQIPTDQWNTIPTNPPVSGTSSSFGQTSEQILGATIASNTQPAEAELLGSFASPYIQTTQTNAASAQLDSGSLMRNQTLIRTLTKNMNISVQPDSGSNYISKIEHTDADPENIPETAKLKWEALSAKIVKEDIISKKKKKNKGKSVKIQTFLNATRDYISSNFAPKKGARSRDGSKEPVERKQRKSIRAAKSENDLDSPEADLGSSETTHQDQAKIKQIANTISLRSLNNIERMGTFALDIAEENFPSGVSQTSLSSEAIPSIPGISRQVTGRQKPCDDTIFEIDTEKEMTPCFPAMRRTKPVTNAHANALVAEGILMAILPGGAVKPPMPQGEKRRDTIATPTPTFTKQGSGLKRQSTTVGARNRFMNGFRVFVIGLVIFALTYIAFPVAVMFGAHDYKNYLVRTVLNFGLLGILTGVAQVLLIYYSVDVPIQKRIDQIEGTNKGLFEASKYLILNKFMIASILLVNFGAQIGVGLIEHEQGIDSNALAVSVGALCVAIMTSLMLFLVVSALNPKRQKDEKKILNKEIQHIEEARKDFLNELQTTRNFLDEKENLQFTARSLYGLGGGHSSRPSISMHTLLTERPLIPDSTRSTMLKIKDKDETFANNNIDTRKLQNKAYDYSKEFKALRLKGLRALLILIFALVELIILTQIVEALHKNGELAVKLVLVAIIALIGVIFGIVNPITWARIPKLTTMKIVSIVVASAVYRYLFLDFSSSTALICAAAVKFAFKSVTIGSNSILGKVFYKYFGSQSTNKELDIIHYTRPEEKDQMNIRYPKYLLHKGIISQEVDIFFTLVAIVAFVYNKFASSSVNINFDTYVNPLSIYPWVLLAELALDVLIMMVYIGVGERILKKKVTVTKINGWSESYKGLMKRKWTLFSFKALALFILYLSRSNLD